MACQVPQSKSCARLLLFGMSSVPLPDPQLVSVIAWQRSQYNALAQDEFSQLADSDLEHTVKGVCNMVETQGYPARPMKRKNRPSGISIS